MNQSKKNYKLVADHVFNALKYHFGKYIIKVDNYTYTFIKNKKDDYSLKEVNPKLLVTLKDFCDDLVKHLEADIPLVLTMGKKAKFESYEKSSFLEDLMKPFYYKKYKFPFDIEPKKFKKLMLLFKCISCEFPISALFPSTTNCSIFSNPYHFEFTKEILSLEFDNDLSDYYKLYRVISADMRTIEKYYVNTKSLVIKEGLINYLKNKKEFLEKYKDKDYESSLLVEVKKIMHSDHWSDLALCFPIYAEIRNKQISNDKLFEIGSYSTYYIELNKDNLLNYSRSTISDDDIFDMMSFIINALNSVKPDDMNNVEISQPYENNEGDKCWDNPKIYLSGKNLNKIKVQKFISILEKMITEYNGSNIDKNKVYDSKFYERKKANKEFIRKIAEAFWLDFELDDSSGRDKKVHKV